MARLLFPLAFLLLFSASAAHTNHFPTPGREVPVPFPPDAATSGTQHSPDVACSSTSCLVVWMSSSSTNRHIYEIRGARVSGTGQLLDSSSFTIATADFLNTTRPQTVALKSGFAVFYGGGLAANVSHDGVVLSRDRRFSFSTRLVSIQEAVVAGSSVLLYWQENRGPLIPALTIVGSDLKELRDVRVEGYPQDITASTTNFVIASAAVDGLKVTRLAENGSVLSSSVIPLQLQDSFPVLAATDRSALVAWRRRGDATRAPGVQVAAITGDRVQQPQLIDAFVSSGVASSLDVASAGGDFLVTWSRPSSGHYSDNAYMLRFGDNGVAFGTPTTLSSDPSLKLYVKAGAMDGRYLAAWTDSRFGLGHDHVFATMVAAGVPGSDFLLSRRVGQTSPVLAAVGEVIGIAWSEAEQDAFGAVKFMRAGSDGSLKGEPLQLSGSGGKPAIAGHGEVFSVGWREHGLVRVTVIGSDGRLLGSGQLQARAGSDVAVVATEQGVAAVWSEEGKVRFARMTPSGNWLDPVPQVSGEGDDPRIAFDGSSYWIVARAGSGGVLAWRQATDGRVIDTIPFRLESEGSQADQLAFTCSGSGCIALWRARRDEQTAVEGALLHSTGAPVRIVVAHGDGASQPAVAWNGKSWMIAWSARSISGADLDVVASEISVMGNVPPGAADDHDARIGATGSDESSPAVAAAGHSRAFAFGRASSVTGERIYLRFDTGSPPRRRGVRR